MPEFSELARPVLVAISRASGDSYGDIDGRELLAELRAMGHEPDDVTLYNLLFRLRDGDYLSFHGVGLGGGVDGFSLIRLEPRGREEVEGWPKASGLSTADVEALLALIDARADDANLPEGERRKWGKLRDDAHAVGVTAVGGLITAWLKSLGAA